MPLVRTLTLIVSLAAPPASGPLATAASLEGQRLAATATPASVQKGGAHADWSRVTKLEPGTAVLVTVGDERPRARHIVLSDDTGLTLINTAPLTAGARRDLLYVARNQPAHFAPGETNFVYKSVRVTPDGVFVADQKIAERDRVVERVRRSDVRLVQTERFRGSRLAGLGGTVAGAAVGFLLALELTYDRPCQPHCGDEEALALLALAGVPVAGGIAAYRATGRKTADIIYDAR